MKICHVCKAVCEDNAELCSVCGADLTEIENKEDVTSKEITNPVLLASIEDVVSAEIFRDVLIDNGIMFSCDEAENEGIKVVFGGNLISVDIYVDESDFETAQELYSEFLKSETEFDGEFFFDEEEITEE